MGSSMLSDLSRSVSVKHSAGVACLTKIERGAASEERVLVGSRHCEELM